MRKNDLRKVVIAGVLFAGACSSGNNNSGTGGSPGTGGSATGGTANTGGAGQTGGSPGTGGGTSTGGAANGGRAQGGSVATGGAKTGGSGGATATGGSGGATATGGSGGGSTPSGTTVKLDATRQTIQGFGINDALLGESWGATVLDNLFTTKNADSIGLSILRIGMNSGGSLAGTTPANLSGAKTRGAKIIGSCWTPPASCKSNNNEKQGGYLLSSCFDSWSKTIATFAKNQGLYAMSIGNESDFASCASKGPPCTTDYETTTYTGKQMVAWVKAAKKTFQSMAPDVKIIAPEASEWIHAWSNASATGSLVASHPQSSDPHNCGCYSNTISEVGCAQKCLDGDGYDYGHWLWKDQEAWKSFDIFGVHEYDSQIAYAWPADVNGGKRDKEVWQTEMSGVKHWPEQGPSKTIENGLAVAGWIHSALTVGEASAWVWWWYQAYYEDDNEGLALLKGESASTAKAKRYYTLGNYSKFVRPDYIAVEVVGNSNADVLLSAYKGPDGTVVVVAINKGSAAANLPISIAGGTAPATMTPNVTSASDNLKAGTAVPVTGGAFMASLPSKSVTTFVGK